VHRLSPGRAGRRDQLVDDEVTLAGGRRSDRHRLVREQDVKRLAIGLGEDGDGLDAELAARPDDPDGDLAAIRDEDLLERGAHVASMIAGTDPSPLPLPSGERAG
jgi:hypothetical protein